jgi:hypothetical protein
MYVKWKQGYHHRFPCVVESAYVVESYRTPAGPRLRYVCYLGSIAHPKDGGWRPPYDGFVSFELIEPFIGGESCRHSQFWATALDNLDRVGIVGEDREKIIASLERVVPRPSEEEIKSEEEGVRRRRRAAADRAEAEKEHRLPEILAAMRAERAARDNAE